MVDPNSTTPRRAQPNPSRILHRVLDEYPELDLGIDGADQIDPFLNAIKGHGGAMLREKIVAACCKEYILIVDETKVTEVLGTSQDVFLEVHPFAITPVLNKIIKMGAKASVRQAYNKLLAQPHSLYSFESHLSYF